MLSDDVLVSGFISTEAAQLGHLGRVRWMILGWWEHCSMFSSIHGLCPLDARNTHQLCVATPAITKCCQNCLRLRISNLIT